MRRLLAIAAVLFLVCRPALADISHGGVYPIPPITPLHIPMFNDGTGFPLGDSGIGVTSGRITGVANPVGTQDAATKSYVDANAAGVVIHAAVRAASTASLTATYSNGASGVGATLTNSGTLAALVIDGVTIANGDRILIKDQATQFQNGAYTQTTTGTGAIAWVLTRATDFDQVTAAEVATGARFNATLGTVNTSTAWLESGQGPFTIGATAVVFSQDGGGGAITCSQMPALTGDTTSVAAGCVTVTSKVNGAAYPSSPAANTVPVVTSATSGGTVTYEAVPNAALANASVTVNTVPCTLGSTCTITATLSGLTNNVITKGTSGTTVGSSSISDNGTAVSTSEPVSTGGVGISTGDVTQFVPNNATATVLHGLAIFATGTYQATAALTSSTTNIIGICDGGCGNTGSATIAWGGLVQCTFDGATTAGHFVVASTTVANNCHDAGATVASAGAAQVLGQVTTTNVAGGTFNLDMNPVGIHAALNSKTAPGGTTGQLQYNNAGAFGGLTPSGDWTITASTGVDVVGKVNSVTYPSGPAANTVPVVTSATSGGAVTYEAVPNAALANASMTIAGHSVALGGTQTLACADLTGVAASCSTDTTNATNIASGTLAAARLPNPSSTTLGGIQSKAVATHQFLTSISTAGVPGQAQPSAADVSGLATTATSNALSALATQAANTVVANVSGSTAAPTAASVPSCVDANGNHLNYTNGTGFSCGTLAPVSLIATHTAAAATDIEFTGLTSTYNTLFLNCEGLTTGAGDAIFYRVGTGVGPSWQSGGDYTVTVMYTGKFNIPPTGVATTTAFDLTAAGSSSTSLPSSMKLYIDNVGSVSIPKIATWAESQSTNDPAFYTSNGSSYWHLSNAAITGLQIIAPSPITGTCSLFGMS